MPWREFGRRWWREEGRKVFQGLSRPSLPGSAPDAPRALGSEGGALERSVPAAAGDFGGAKQQRGVPRQANPFCQPPECGLFIPGRSLGRPDCQGQTDLQSSWHSTEVSLLICSLGFSDNFFEGHHPRILSCAWAVSPLSLLLSCDHCFCIINLFAVFCIY